MVKYGFAVGVLVASASGSVHGFAPARSLLSPSVKREIRAGLRRGISASTLYDPEFDRNDINASFQTVSAEYLDSLSGVLSDDDDAVEVQMALKKKVVKDRVQKSLGTFQLSFSTIAPLGMSLCQVDPGLVFSEVDLNVDTLSSQPAPLPGATQDLATMDLEATKKRIGSKFRGLLVSSVVKGGCAWQAGVRPGDALVATSATIGDSLWPKSTLDGVRSAISSRKVVSGMIDFQFQRASEAGVSAQTYELTLARPIGIEIEETPDGYVQVTGFTENAPRLVKYAINIGDRILAVDSSIGGSMWPVSTAAGVISACTSRLPGQSITIRFERPENLNGEGLTTAAMVSPVREQQSILLKAGPKQETLLKRCRDVLRKYKNEEQQDEQKNFSGKYSVPSLVADKVLDAVASASTSLDAKTLCMIMNAYLSCKQPEAAIRAFETSVGISADGSFITSTSTIHGKEKGTLIPNLDALNLYTVSSLMRAHSLLGDIASVRRVLWALEGKSGIDVDGKVTGVWPRSGSTASIIPDTQLYNIALSAAARSDESLEDLLMLFNNMRDRKDFEEGPVKDTVSYNTVINALAQAGKFEDAFAAFYTMKRSGIKPDKFTYTSLVKACVQDGDTRELLFDMQEEGVKADVVMYNFIIRNLCESGKWYDAKKLVTQMEASGIAPDAMTYGFLMNGLLIAKKPSACLSLFEAACAESKTISLTENVHLFTTAITAASALENHEKAFHLINRMKIAGIKPNIKTLTALMGACMSSGKYALATEVYKQIEVPDAVAKSKGVEAFCLEANFDKAMEILTSKEGPEMSGKQQMMAHGHLLRNSLMGGNMKVARDAFKAFLGAGFIPSKNTFLIIIQALNLVPPKKRNLPFAKVIPEENFSFLLFVMDSIRERKLPCDGVFYTSVLLAGSRIGGLRRKICSLMTESRGKTEEPESYQRQTLVQDNSVPVLNEISWEDLLHNYDAIKADIGVHLSLPSLTVRMGKDDVRQVLTAEHEVTYKGVARRKLKSTAPLVSLSS